MPVMREAVRLLAQAVRFAVAGRSLGLLVFLLLGAFLVLVALVVSASAPVLIYPFL
jgi:hypothetical protein